MLFSWRALALVTFSLWQTSLGAEDTYSAVVVEYSPLHEPTLDPETNILNNVRKYVEYIKLANSPDIMADIIVFPEIGLRGYRNQEQYLEIPDPADLVLPCAHNTTYEAPLVQLSCAARATATYVVINLSEKFYNSSLQRTQYFNTDVVFDLNGVVVARYRKIHLFGEGMRESPMNNELVYFNTTFGVRFGIFTCFDIIFKDPVLVVAKEFNVSHFIFPTAWFSEMPFLTAIQEQWYWSFTQDAVLLASGYNYPPAGSSGTGIYLGRQGPLVYSMTEATGSFLLHATIPKQFPSSGTTKEAKLSTKVVKDDYVFNDVRQGPRLATDTTPTTIKMKRDNLDVYTTVPISPPDSLQPTLNGSAKVFSFTFNDTVCQGSFCCEFSLSVTSVFSQARPNITRGDDYSQLHYRLAAFDGVRNYDGAATGGLQTCAILPCVNSSLASCGLTSRDPSTQPNTYLGLFQTDFVFESISITGVFSNNDSFVGPNVLLEGQHEDFGSLLPSDRFVFSKEDETAMTVTSTFQTVQPISNLVTASVYGRVFSRDGQAYTGYKATSGDSSRYDLYRNVALLRDAVSRPTSHPKVSNGRKEV